MGETAVQLANWRSVWAVPLAKYYLENLECDDFNRAIVWSGALC